jgi:mannose-1-phosphate guanylyltransferase
MKIVILAGGSGTRLWPRSRARYPKQFLDLVVPGQSLLQETVERIRPLVTPQDILVVTGRSFVQKVARQLPDVPRANILSEPCGRGSAPAIGLAAVTIRQRWGDDVMVSLHSDHHVAHPETLRNALVGAAGLAQKGRLATLGIVPSEPHTGLGYIRRGETLGAANGFAAYSIARFVEKPDYATAKTYVESGEYYWNTGMFVWNTATILSEMAALMPALYAQLTGLQATLGTRQEKAAQTRVWQDLPVEQIDFGVMEKTRLGAVVAVDNMGWNDIGDWNSMNDICSADEHGNITIGQVEGVDLSNCIIVGTGKRMIGAIGLKDMVIVETDDAILVCPRQRAQDVRKLVDKLRAAKKEKYL